MPDGWSVYRARREGEGEGERDCVVGVLPPQARMYCSAPCLASPAVVSPGMGILNGCEWYVLALWLVVAQLDL